MNPFRPSPRARRATSTTWRAAGVVVRRLAVAACALTCLPGQATDLVAARPPVEITDGQVSIGPRTLHLPPGRWFYVDHQEIQRHGGPRVQAPATEDVAFLLRVDHGQATLGIRLGLLRSDLARPSWDFECMAPGTIYFKDRTSSPGQADCLYVSDRRNAGHAIEAWSAPAARWLEAKGIASPGSLVFVRYQRFGSNSHGMVILLIPTAHFESEASVDEWAESLRDALKPWLEHRTDEASLPALPEPEPEPSTGGVAPPAPDAKAASAP